ncbi:MAG TPA: UbiA family prenyltransferase [Isosphaeraceae bacterium]
MRRIKPYLQLVRLPNLFTAAADPLAGWLLVGGSLGDAGGWAPLVAAGVATYAAGMVLNDVFDFEVDRVERPGRPLPSGRVSRRLAALAGVVLLISGPALAAISGATAAGVASVLAACVLAYDAGLKRTVLGPEVMGACRALNLLLGMTADPRLGGPAGWLAAAAFGLFVCGITWISRDEARVDAVQGRRRGVVAGMAVQDVALLGLLMACFQIVPFPHGDASRPSALLLGSVVLCVTAWVVNHADVRAVREPTPGRIQAAVKAGVLSLVWLDVGVVASVRGVMPALAVAALWLPAFLLGRWLYST